MNNENIKEILKSIGAEEIPADVQKLAQETSNNFSKSLTQQQPKQRQSILLEYIMRSKMPKLAAAAVIVIAVLIVLNLTSRDRVAWAKLVDRVEKIQTVAYQMRMKMKGFPGAPKDQLIESDMDVKLAYDRGIYIDTVTHAPDRDVKTESYIRFDKGDLVTVMPGERKYLKVKLTEDLKAQMEKNNGDPRAMLKETMQYNYTKLGRDTINGIAVEGIEVTDPALGQGMFDTIVAQLWCDVKTDLPVQMTMKGSTNNDEMVLDITIDKFNWDADIATAELVPNIPADYELLAETEMGGGSKDGKDLVEVLRFFAEMADGRYPTTLTSMNVIKEFADAIRVKFAGQQQGEPDKEVLAKIVKLQTIGMTYTAMVKDGNEPAYYGAKVTAEFPHAVLMRWKMGENKYRVILGDLSIRDVGLQELTRLEAAPLNPDPKPIKPNPADGTEGMALTGRKLKWMAGANAAEHKVLFGTSGDDLSLVATTTATEYDALPDLKRGATYYWRVDEVSADGKVAQGDVWTFGAGSLVAWYRFDEGSGDAVGDSGPAKIDGAALGDPAWTDNGAVGKALQFDGKDDCVDLGNHPKFDIRSQITVAAWIKVSAFDREYQTIIAKGDGTWRLQRNCCENTLEFACTGAPVPNNSWGGIYGNTNVNDGQWHHVAGIYDGSTISLYVDGKPDIAVTAAGSIKSNDQSVCIGENAEKPGRFWNGLIDDVRVYNYALSPDEITEIASSE